LAGAEGFFASVAQAQQTDGGDEEQARFDEEFAAIEPVHRGIGKRFRRLRRKWARIHA